MLSKKIAQRIAWVGPNDDSCGYLLDRFTASCEQFGFPADVCKTQSLDWDSLRDRDRIVLVAHSRANYPDGAIQQLTTTPNIVPWGVVTNSWHAGSRRSGQGAVTHWQQPWYRWWDSWAGWFFPESARPGSVLSKAFSPVITAMDYSFPTVAPKLPPTDRHLAILCGCLQTASMLQQQAQHAGWSGCVYRSLTDFQATPVVRSDIILWDDSLLPCLPHLDLTEPVDELLSQLIEVVPTSRLIASIDLEHLHLWPRVQRRGCTELLVKPSHALALSNYLYCRSTLGNAETAARHSQECSSTIGMAAGAGDR